MHDEMHRYGYEGVGKMIDEIDVRILEILAEHGNATSTEIASRIKLSVPAINKRINKLSKSNVIEKYTISVNAQMVSKPLMAFIFIEFEGYEVFDKLFAVVKDDKDFLEFYTITGDFDYILKVRAKDMLDVERKLARIKAVTGVTRTNTMFTLIAHKNEPTVLPD